MVLVVWGVVDLWSCTDLPTCWGKEEEEEEAERRCSGGGVVVVVKGSRIGTKATVGVISAAMIRTRRRGRGRVGAPPRIARGSGRRRAMSRAWLSAE